MKFLLFVVVVIAAVPDAAYSQQNVNVRLQAILSDNEIQYSETADAFHTALDRAGLPGGAVWLLNCNNDQAPQVMNTTNLSLQQVLNQLTRADTRYHWQIAGAVVNLLPVTGEPSLLTTHVDPFETSYLSPSEALTVLLGRPEVRRALKDRHLELGLTFVKSLSPTKPTRLTVRFEGGTLREALNKIAQTSGKAQWEYFENHCDGKSEVSIRF